MKFKSWIRAIIDKGYLCDIYSKKVYNAVSKKELMDIVLDANGVSYLLEMDEREMGLPYETIISEFGNYINGKYEAEFKNDKKRGYNSKIYCCYTDSANIDIDTTVTVLLGCNNNINIRQNDFVKIYADKNCDISINCPKSSQCIIEYSEGALIGTNSNSNIKLIKRHNGGQ